MERHMMTVSIAALLALSSACGGKTEGSEPGGASSTVPREDACFLSGAEWTCRTSLGDSLAYPECTTEIASGGSCSDQTVDTTNPTMPAHITPGDCFNCASGGAGTVWQCSSSTWQVSGHYSCSP